MFVVCDNILMTYSKQCFECQTTRSECELDVRDVKRETKDRKAEIFVFMSFVDLGYYRE